MEFADDRRALSAKELRGAVGIIVALLAVIAVVILFFVFVFAPFVGRSNAARAQHEAQQLSAVHRAGFTHVRAVDIQNDGWSNYFNYPVGSCSTPVYISRLSGQYRLYRMYILLKSVQNARVYVTLHSLMNLPQTASCFVK